MKKAFIFAVALVMATTSYAMRCGSGLVQVGDTKIEVLKSCGEPIFKEFAGTMFKWVEYERIARNVKVIVERWHYDVGGGVIHVLTFAGPDLVDIEYYRK